MFRRVAGRPVLPCMDLAAQRRRTISRCQRNMVSGGDKQMQPAAAGFRYHGEQGRQECAVRPVQPRAAPLQDSELMAQDQDLCGLPSLLTPGGPQLRGQPRGQEEHEPQSHDR